MESSNLKTVSRYDEEDEEDSFGTPNSKSSMEMERNQRTNLSEDGEISFQTAHEDSGSAKLLLKLSKDDDYWKRPKVVHNLSCLYFFISQVILPLADVSTDLVLGALYLSNDNIFHGTLTLLCIILPALFIILTKIFQRIKDICHKRNPDEALSSFFGIHHYLPFFQAIRNFRIFVGLSTMDTINPTNFGLVRKLKSEADDISMTESILESGPQIILQLYIILTTGSSNLLQLLCVIISIFSLWSTSFIMFFSGRFPEEKEINPSLRFMLSMAPFAFVDILASIGIVFSIILVSGGKGLIAIPIIIVLSSLLGVPLRSQPSALASWVMSGLMVSWSKLKLPLALTVIAVTTYSLTIIISIDSQLRSAVNSTGNNHPLCVGYRMWTEIFLQLPINSNSRLERNVEICDVDDDKELHSFIINILVPFVTFCLICKCASGIMLSKLTDFRRLEKFIGFGIGKELNFFKALERPEKYMLEDQLYKILHKNIDFANIQHPLTGTTIMHKVAGLLPHSDLEKLYRNGARLDIEDFEGQTAMAMCEKAGKPFTLSNKTDQIPNHLIKCIEKEDYNKFRILVAFGAIPESRNMDSESSLSIISKDPHKYEKFIHYLHGKDPSGMSKEDQQENDEDRTVRLVESEKDRCDCDKLRQMAKAGVTFVVEELATLLIKACQSGHSDCLKLLLESDANPNCTDQKGWTPLHAAVEEGHLDCVKLLLEARADPNVMDEKGLAPLHIACHFDCVELQLYSNIKDQKGRTPFDFTVEKGRVDFSKVSLEAKSEPNIKDMEHSTPLRMAHQSGHSDCVKLLLESYANPNIKDQKGRTPLHAAIEKSHLDCVKLLLKAKADLNVEDDDGLSPLHLACRNGHPDCVRLLLESDLDQNIRYQRGWIPVEKGHVDSAELLLKTYREKLQLEFGVHLDIENQKGVKSCEDAIKNDDDGSAKSFLRLTRDQIPSTFVVPQYHFIQPSDSRPFRSNNLSSVLHKHQRGSKGDSITKKEFEQFERPMRKSSLSDECFSE